MNRMDCRDIALEWNAESSDINLVTSYYSTKKQIPPAPYLSTSILNTKIPFDRVKTTGSVDSENNSGEVTFIKVPINELQVSRANRIQSTQNPDALPTCSGVPFCYVNYMYTGPKNNPEEDMLVLKSDKVPGEYITSIKIKDWQQLLLDVEQKLIVAAAVDTVNASMNELKQTQKLKQTRKPTEQSPQELQSVSLLQPGVSCESPSVVALHITLPSTVPTSLLDVLSSNVGICTPTEGSRGGSRGKSKIGNINKKPSLLSGNDD